MEFKLPLELMEIREEMKICVDSLSYSSSRSSLDSKNAQGEKECLQREKLSV